MFRPDERSSKQLDKQADSSSMSKADRWKESSQTWLPVTPESRPTSNSSASGDSPPAATEKGDNRTDLLVAEHFINSVNKSGGKTSSSSFVEKYFQQLESGEADKRREDKRDRREGRDSGDRRGSGERREKDSGERREKDSAERRERDSGERRERESGERRDRDRSSRRDRQEARKSRGSREESPVKEKRRKEDKKRRSDVQVVDLCDSD